MGLLDLFKPNFFSSDNGLTLVQALNSEDDSSKSSRARLFNMVSNLEVPLRLQDPSSEVNKYLFQLYFNALAVEFRDMFRIIEGLLHHAHEGSLQGEHLAVFYEWFEGFFGILTLLFDTEENVFFPWIESTGCFKIENSFGPKRRLKKKDRAKELCWDILELRGAFDMKTDRKAGLFNLVYELRDEAEHLSARVMGYSQSALDELPFVLESKFNSDERRHIDMTVVHSYRSSEEGQFVLCAMSRGIPDSAMRNGFLEENFRSSHQKGGVPKQLRKFRRKHTDLVDKIAVRDLQIDGDA